MSYQRAADVIKNAKRIVAFTGAGISVESGIPPFRGEGGLWNTYNPMYLYLQFFHAEPQRSWEIIKEIIYDHFGKAKPNAAHAALATLQQHNLLHAIITQNIDNLHQDAGSTEVYEFHGNSQHVICLSCSVRYPIKSIDLQYLPPRCMHCQGLLKPDFVFFGEAIPKLAHTKAFYEAEHADVLLVVGTTGEVAPASLVPEIAKQHGATLIEVNIDPSNYTPHLTDIFLQGKATEVMTQLIEALHL